VEYREGIHIGYRAWLRGDAEPAYWFGSGQGYTDISLTGVEAPAGAQPGAQVTLTAHLTNRGPRDGKQVVQVYAERTDSAVDRPVRWLVGFAPVRVPAGEATSVQIDVPTRRLACWAGGWQYEPGDYRLRFGTSATDLPLNVTVRLDA
jgi:beta-glucosidase